MIERQRAEIDDLRARLIERKRLEETWKEMLNVLLNSIKNDYTKQKVTVQFEPLGPSTFRFRDSPVLQTLQSRT